MSTHNIDPRRVAGVVHEINLALSTKGFNSAEVMIGLSEMLGRSIVEHGGTPVQGAELAKVCTDHLERTLQAGYGAKGWNFQPEGEA